MLVVAGEGGLGAVSADCDSFITRNRDIQSHRYRVDAWGGGGGGCVCVCGEGGWLALEANGKIRNNTNRNSKNREETLS